jgi:hypothetical protein
VSPPLLRGSEHYVRDLFSTCDVEHAFERAVLAYTFGSAEELMRFYETNYGPTIRAKATLERTGRRGDCRTELGDLFDSHNRLTDDAGRRIEAEYMLILARPQ